MMGLLCRDFTKLQKINDWVPMLEDWVPMQKDWVPMQEHTTVFVEQASPVKNENTLADNLAEAMLGSASAWLRLS